MLVDEPEWGVGELVREGLERETVLTEGLEERDAVGVVVGNELVGEREAGR